MNLEMKKLFKRLIPQYLVCGVRAVNILLLERGQVRKDREGRCIDKNKEHIPWLTYSSIDFLKSFDLTMCEVFEYGSGSSTLFWSNCCKNVISIEHYEPWFEKMNRCQQENITIKAQYDLKKYPDELSAYGLFDIIVIDGAERMRCTNIAIEHLKENGIIILDNSEWYPNCCTLLRSKGFTQLDFCGFTPINSFTAMTSIFFKDKIILPYKSKEKAWIPIGGKRLEECPPDDVFINF